MAVFAFICIFSILGCADADRAVELAIVGVSLVETESTLEPSKVETDCSGLLTHAGKQVNCEVVKSLAGGRQANTNIVVIDGKNYVMKETHSPQTVDNLNQERHIVKILQKAHFTDMPRYHLAFDAAKPGSAVLVMDLLDGFFDLHGQTPLESQAVRDVRAAAFFIALDRLYLAKVSHCDLNLGNVMFKESDPTVCVLIDFGMASINYGPVGTCNAMNGIPDLGYDGAAWKLVYPALQTSEAISSVCPERCDSQRYFAQIVAKSKQLIAAFNQQQLQPLEPQPQQKRAEYPQADLQYQQRPARPPFELDALPRLQPEGGRPEADMIGVSSRKLAEEIRTGMHVEFEGRPGIAYDPEIVGNALHFDFVPADGSKKELLRAFWGSGKLKAAI